MDMLEVVDVAIMLILDVHRHAQADKLFDQVLVKVHPWLTPTTTANQPCTNQDILSCFSLARDCRRTSTLIRTLATMQGITFKILDVTTQR
jgi:hypothetical protein